MKKHYMAIDQYGYTYHGLEFPRRDLLRQLGRTKAKKMYQDTKGGETYCTGYIIGGLWLSVYEVNPVQWPAD